MHKNEKNLKTRRKKSECKRHNALRRFFGAILKIFLICVCAAVAFIAITNLVMVMMTNGRIISADEAAALAKQDGKFACAEVLGAAVKNDIPSNILADRIDAGMALVQNGTADILLFSGDNGSNEYNELSAMKKYAVKNGGTYGVTEDNIYLDYAGFSTYDSMYRLRDVFATKRAIIVTQKYHLYRALYIADRLGIDAYGVVAEPVEIGQTGRDIREIFARTKDFIYVIIGHQPKYLGETVNLTYPARQSPDA